jgi:hypothetical protein
MLMTHPNCTAKASETHKIQKLERETREAEKKDSLLDSGWSAKIV